MSARTKVYVGNLAYETSWQGLKDHFRQAGEVLHADVLHEPSGRSKGCGLVSFASAAEAAHAIATLSETELDGRAIFVREDREAALPGLPAPQARGASSPAGGATQASQQPPPFGGGLPPAPAAVKPSYAAAPTMGANKQSVEKVMEVLFTQSTIMVEMLWLESHCF